MLATLERGIKGGKKCLFRRARANLLSLNPSQSGQRSLGAPLTGEPDAGKPPVRFGGRGEVTTLAPTPIAAFGRSLVLLEASICPPRGVGGNLELTSKDT